MIISAISDTHGRPFTIPPCDVFIHAGDITAGGSLQETATFAVWLAQQTQAKHKLITPGNHDAVFQQEPDLVRHVFSGIATVLIDESVTIDGVMFHGSPWTPPFMNWSWMMAENGLAEVYKRMSEDVDILFTHGPPYGIFDTGYQEPHVGSKSLGSAVAHRMINHHIFGHLHHDGGNSLYSPEETHLETTFHNVAACDDAYKLVRQPIIIEL
jgi:Icc-related predicted phosphoesterase